MSTDEHLVAGGGTLHWMAEYRFIQNLPWEKQAMEMTEYGKHGKP
jgi:diadenosine tetraphosphatase ApaH/serine/threonine PP2A family protein phosphatase